MMTMKWSLGVLAALAFVTNALAQTPASKLKIGVLTDMSGVYSALSGPGSVEAARLAIEDFGGKVLGRPIELISADHQNKPDVGVAIARKWYEVEDVSLIVDVPTSSVALGVTSLSKQFKKLLIISSGAGEVLTEKECSPYTIAWTWDNYSLLKGLVTPLLAEGADTWFFVGPDYAYGRAAAATVKTMVEQNGGKYVGEVFHPLNGSDFASFLLAAQASNAKVIAVASGGADAQNLAKQGRDFAIFPKQRLALLANTITDTHGVGLATMSGTVSIAPFYWDRNDATRALSKRFFERTKAALGETQSGVYSAVLNYLKAVESAGSLDADKIVASLRSNKIEDAFAQNAKLLPNGRMIHDMYLLETKAPTDSKYPWDYYKVLKTIPGEQAFRPIAETQCPLVKK